MNRSELVKQIFEKKSCLCVGLDTDLAKIPSFLLDFEDPIFEFNKRVIDATAPYCVAYKPNIAFYEKLGPKGWTSLEKTLAYIPDNIFTIADAKRGDIGNTSSYYAQTFFETYQFDSLTVAPYMGSDSVQPYYGFDEKWVIILALTSNKGSADFQQQTLSSGEKVFSQVLKTSSQWGDETNTMYVVGATKADALKEIRAIVPDHFLLIPGVGAQGGDIHAVLKHGMTKDVALLINSSRGIIYAGGQSETFDKDVAQAARFVQEVMAEYI